MCIRIQYAPYPAACSQSFDADRQVITLPDGLPRSVTLLVVRSVLSELAIEQPQMGAVCWCGAAVPVLPRIPQQMRREQVTHGS